MSNRQTHRQPRKEVPSRREASAVAERIRPAHSNGSSLNLVKGNGGPHPVPAATQNGGGVLARAVHGTVEHFKDDSGYGFIRPDASVAGVKKDVFVHYTAIVGEGHRSLAKGDKVLFDILEDPKGPRAEHVERLARKGR